MWDLDQIHSSHLGFKKTGLLACETVYWVNVNCAVENTVKHCSTCLVFQQMQPKEKTIPHELPDKPLEVTDVDMFSNHSIYLCLVDYHCKFPVIKRTESLSVDSLTLSCKFFSEYRLQKKIMSDGGDNFVSEIQRNLQKPKHRASSLVIIPATSNGNVEACIKLVKCT